MISGLKDWLAALETDDPGASEDRHPLYVAEQRE
jgi:hypothetical protein